MSSNGELDASNAIKNFKEVGSSLILCECVFVLVKKPAGIFVIVFIELSSQWNVVISQNFCIFKESCYDDTLSGVYAEKPGSRKLISILSPH